MTKSTIPLPTKYNLPVNYDKLKFYERRLVRNQYIQEQQGLCFWCKEELADNPPSRITNKSIDWKLFPGGIKFLIYPVHLQHNHTSNLTEGAIHAYCNAVMWQFYGK